MAVDRQTVICGARTRSGGRCKHAPTPGSVPPRCHWHNGASHSAGGQPRCKAQSRVGQRCRQWAAPGSAYCLRHKVRGKGEEAQPCTALTSKGRPCRALAVSDSHPPRCTFHGPQWRERKRCEARTKRGHRCRRWAMRESLKKGRPLCAWHAGLCAGPRKEDYGAARQYGRGCEARTAEGKRCGNWAMLGSERRFGRALCSTHAIEVVERGAGPESESRGKRCEAQTRAGQRCRNRALRQSQARYGRWLCLFHAEDGQASRPGPQTLTREGRRCTAHTASGERCRKWALADGSWPGDKPLCAIHAGREHSPRVYHGYYSQRPDFSAKEQAAILKAVEGGEPLAAEVLIVRLKLRRLIGYLAREDLPAWRKDAAARALFRGANAVKRLMQARYNLARIRWGPTSAGNVDKQLAALGDSADPGQPA